MGNAYRCEAASVAGFVKQLAVSYIGHGYWFYVTGHVPEAKDPRLIDEKLIAKYGVAISRPTRSRRKAAGLANVHYIRHERFFVLLATAGKHVFFEEEEATIRDAREAPVKYSGYSISFHGGHPSVRIEDQLYRDLKAYFTELAVHRSRDWLETSLGGLRFEPYAPVRRQLLAVLRAVNRRRSEAQFEAVPKSCLRLGRRLSIPFGLGVRREV